MLDLLFFAAIAAFLAFRFYNTLGKRDHDPEENVLRSLREAKQRSQQQEEDNVITLSPDEVKIVEDEPLDKDVQKGVTAIEKQEPDFSAEQFVAGASRAFEMIIEAFSNGDKETLKNLLSDEVYHEFEADISAREKEKQTLSVTLVSGPKASIKQVNVTGKQAEISVQFDSREIRILKDEKGRIIEGDPSDAEAVKDLWTFAKKLDKKTNIWQLVDTEAL